MLDTVRLPSSAPAGYPALHTVTPLIFSEKLSKRSRHNIWLKLENEQLTKSFKPRGIGRSCYAAVQRYGKDVRLIVASGGNAGLAAALSAQTLGVKCTIFVHAQTETLIKDRMRSFGAEVKVTEGGWEYVDASARQLAEEDPNGHYVHPFEGDDLVRGHTSVIEEIYEQLPKVSEDKGMERVSRPDAICSAVGGGGMIRGIMLGLSEQAALSNTPPVHVIGVTTFGSDSWGRSLEVDDGVTEIDPFSRAKSLACKKCSPLSVRDARIYAARGELSLDSEPVSGPAGKYLSEVRMDDAYAGAAAWESTNELNHLVELSCGAAIAVACQPAVLEHIVQTKELPEKSNIVIIVCGGSRVSLSDVNGFKAEYGETGHGVIIVDGNTIQDVPATSK